MTTTDEEKQTPPATEGLTVANFMDSSLHDLEKKGVFESVHHIYNPGKVYKRVLHFSPHPDDLSLANKLSIHGIELYTHQAAGLNPIKICLAILRIWLFIRRENVDLVRGRLPYLGSFVSVLAARLSKRPFVVSLGGDNRIVQERNRQYNYNSKLISYLMEWFVLRLADVIIVPNRFTGEYVSRIITPQRAEAKCIRIPWISPETPVALTSESCEAEKDPSEPLILVVGFLNRYKYTDIIFELVSEVIQDSTLLAHKANFTFCGDGELLKEGLQRFDQRANISFLGWTENSEVKALMSKADIVLVPMSGFVLLEAAELGKSVIASNVEWHSELVEDGVTGLLVDPLLVSQWTAAIETLLSDPANAKQMGTSLSQRYEMEYSPKICAARELELYQKLVEDCRI